MMLQSSEIGTDQKRRTLQGISYTTLGLIVVITLAFWIIRVISTGSFRFAFLVPNVVLAMVPLLVEPWIAKLSLRPRSSYAYAGIFLLALIWLLFLPNAFYILTDFMHLNGDVVVNRTYDGSTYHPGYARGDGLYIYDSLMLLWATLAGAYLGGKALAHAYCLLKIKCNEFQAIAALGVVMILVGIGVYLGRFSRWNSWEGLLRPDLVVGTFINDLAIADSINRIFWTIGVIFVMEMLSLWLTLTLLREGRR